MQVWIITKIKTLLLAIFDFLFLSPLSSGTQSCTKFLKLKSTNANTRNVIYKIKSNFPQPVQGAMHTILLYLYENYTAVYYKGESRFPFSKKYFKFLKWFLNSSKGIWQGQLSGERRGAGLERTINQAEFSLYHYYKHKTFHGKVLLNS